jgi:hypothetical protein
MKSGVRYRCCLFCFCMVTFLYFGSVVAEHSLTASRKLHLSFDSSCLVLQAGGRYIFELTSGHSFILFKPSLRSSPLWCSKLSSARKPSQVFHAKHTLALVVQRHDQGQRKLAMPMKLAHTSVQGSCKLYLTVFCCQNG